MVELKGGNDGLNTVVPYTDRLYYQARPKLAIPAADVLRLDHQLGFNPAMRALLPIWEQGELALIQGVGYASPNLSHFRSIEIWETASNSQQYLNQGWLSRQFLHLPLASRMIADGVILGSQELGPLAGGARALVLSDPASFIKQARLAAGAAPATNPALAHLLKIENDIRGAAQGLGGNAALQTTFPEHGFGKTVKTACEVLAINRNIGALRLTLGGFDTHSNQRQIQDRLLNELAEGLSALRSGLRELSIWQDCLVLTYAEFGRRVAENRSGGTDHGTANVHFALGGKVKGGFFGSAPDFTDLDADNLRYQIDFRQLYATACRFCWNDTGEVGLGGRFPELAII